MYQGTAHLTRIKASLLTYTHKLRKFVKWNCIMPRTYHDLYLDLDPIVCFLVCKEHYTISDFSLILESEEYGIANNWKIFN